MQKAKNAAANFLSKDGKHNTVVDQDVRQPVTEEHIRPHQHEILTTAVDREVHQDHHQTRVQPINTHETLPEKTSHVTGPTQHTEYHHGNEADTRAKLNQDAAAFKSSSITHETTHSSETAPTISGEHYHHHVHEHIQPVVHKETVDPTVVHKTNPIHETHHAAAIHHETTILPAQSMGEFTANNGGSLHGKSTTTLREFEGCPGPYDKDTNLPSTALHPDSTKFKSAATSSHGSSSVGAGRTGSMGHAENVHGGGQAVGGGNYTYGGNARMTESAATGAGGASSLRAADAADSVPRSEAAGLEHTGTESRARTMMDKLNPLKESEKTASR